MISHILSKTLIICPVLKKLRQFVLIFRTGRMKFGIVPKKHRAKDSAKKKCTLRPPTPVKKNACDEIGMKKIRRAHTRKTLEKQSKKNPFLRSRIWAITSHMDPYGVRIFVPFFVTVFTSMFRYTQKSTCDEIGMKKIRRAHTRKTLEKQSKKNPFLRSRIWAITSHMDPYGVRIFVPFFVTVFTSMFRYTQKTIHFSYVTEFVEETKTI